MHGDGGPTYELNKEYILGWKDAPERMLINFENKLKKEHAPEGGGGSTCLSFFLDTI